MQHPKALVLFLVLLVPAYAKPNLFDDGQLGTMLGTSFGIPGANATFDYVIVGGGTAGLTIATRLAEDPSLSVAVVEAGGFSEIDNGNLSVVPGLSSWFTGWDSKNFQPLIDWGFTTVPQPEAPPQETMSCITGTKGTYQKWADEVDDQSYTFDNLLPYFKKSCQYTPPNQALYTNSSSIQNPAAFSSSGGPLHVSSGNFVDPFGTWGQRALEAVGLTRIDGLNSGHLIGSSYGTFTINPRNAHRSSSESSFLQSAIRKGTRLRVYKNTLAQRILFDHTLSYREHTAAGVVVTTAGTYGVPSLDYILNARKEVIVSAGAIQSPQLLLVSGIDPCKTLRKHKIPCRKNLPGVGQNLWDQISFGTTNRVNVPTTSASLNDPSIAAKNIQLYLQNATGPLSLYGTGYFGWEKLPSPYRSNLTTATQTALDTTFPPDWPELEWLIQNGYSGTNFNKQTTDPRDGHNYATISTALVAPLSRGSVTIRDGHMSTPPLINPNYLSSPADIDLAIQAIHRQRHIWHLLRASGLAIGDEVFPGPHVITDAQITHHVASTFTELYHAAATCKMGGRGDSSAVVDAEARVIGVRGLRVVDASAFPFLPPGHPQATVYALAEKIAEAVLRGMKRRG